MRERDHPDDAPASAPRSPRAWPVRAALAVLLLAGAAWWRASQDFDGAAACEDSALDACDATLTGRLVPFVLWPVTIIVTVLVLALALQLLPSGPGQRVVWATAIASVVLVANSANPYWAVIVASASLVLVVTADDEPATP